MAKVTILIEPEEDNEGTFGHTTYLTKDNVVSSDELFEFFSNAARGAGWIIGDLGEVGERF